MRIIKEQLDKTNTQNQIFNLDKKAINRRVIFLAFAFCLCYIVITFRVVYLSQRDEYSAINLINKKTITRKNIVDRNGKVLATIVPSYSVFLNPKKIVDKDHIINTLSNIIDIDQKTLKNHVNSNKSFIWIKRDITPSQKKKIENLGIPGVEFESENRRVYTYNNVTSHVIGYTGRDNYGLSGIEKYFNEFLLDYSVNKAKELQLSIDIDLQTAVSEELDATIKEFNALGGACVIANVKNGEIYAIVSKPDYDPNKVMNSGISTKDMFPVASLGVYEIGSVFKSILLAMAFDNKTISMQDVYRISNFSVGSFSVKDYHKYDGWYTVPEIFMNSSNIGMAKIALEMGKDDLFKYMKLLGLLDPLSIEIPEKGSPIAPKKKDCGDLTTITMSYGYSISITPVHFTQSMVPILNGGTFFPLTLIKDKNNNEDAKIVLSESVTENMKKLMRLTVASGTGRKADVHGYLVGGKTGTAEKIKNGKYSHNNRLSSFVAVLPSNNPRYVIYLMLDDPKGNKSTYGFATAGFTAAPCVSRIISRMVGILNIPPIDYNDDVKREMQVEYKIDKEV